MDENDDNRMIVIDKEFHSPHEHVLVDLGAVQTPIEGGGSRKGVGLPIISSMPSTHLWMLNHRTALAPVITSWIFRKINS